MVPKAVAVGLQLRGIDVLTTGQAKNLSRPDEDQLDYATREDRVLFTRDSDYAELHAQVLLPTRESSTFLNRGEWGWGA